MPSFFTGAESIAHRNDTPLLESRANAAPVVGGLTLLEKELKAAEITS